MGWGLVPDLSCYEKGSGIFADTLQLRTDLRLKHLYKVGYFYWRKARFEYKVMSAGLTWEECFRKLGEYNEPNIRT